MYRSAQEALEASLFALHCRTVREWQERRRLSLLALSRGGFELYDSVGPMAEVTALLWAEVQQKWHGVG
jgi:hypothetical protein